MLIQEQMRKGGSSSNLWALRQLADFMASHGSPATLPVSPSSMCTTPLKDFATDLELYCYVVDSSWTVLNIIDDCSRT